MPDHVWVNVYSYSLRHRRDDREPGGWVSYPKWTLQVSYYSPSDMAERVRAEALSDFPEVLHGLVWPGSREYKITIEREAGESATKEPQSNE